MTDEQAIKIFKDGGSAGLGFLYDKYFTTVFRYLSWQTSRVEDAEDLTSATMLAMAKGLKKFRGESSFKNWLYQIAKYQLAAWIKKNHYELPISPLTDLIQAHSDWIDPEVQESHIKSLNKILSGLKESDQQLLRLRFLQNYSVKETAKELNISESNVKIRTMRILAKCRAPSKAKGRVV